MNNVPGGGLGLHTPCFHWRNCPCHAGAVLLQQEWRRNQRGCRTVSGHTQELEGVSDASQLGPVVAPQLQTDRARSEGEEVVLPGQKPCPPSRGAASSPGLRDICPASRPQTAAQSHVSTSTRESGNWPWPLRGKGGGGLRSPKVAFQRGDPLS